MERITGRLTYSRAAMAGAASGAWFGLLIGVLLSLFSTSQAAWTAILTGLLIGLAFGITFGLAGYAATGGHRDFTSVSQVVATRYEVLVEHKLLLQAQQLLQQMPNRPPERPRLAGRTPPRPSGGSGHDIAAEPPGRRPGRG